MSAKPVRLLSPKTLFRIHGWIGLHLGLLLFVVCLSGTFATLSNEVDWIADPAVRAGAGAEAEAGEVRWQAMMDALEAEFPDGRMLGLYLRGRTGQTEHFAPMAYVRPADGATRKVYFDATTGGIRAVRNFFNAQRFFRSFHRRFFDGNRGIVLVTLNGFFLLTSALSGLLFYRRWFKNFFTLRWKSRRVVRWSDLHKLSGLWSLLFTLLIAGTGVFYFVELMFQAAGRGDLLHAPAPPGLSAGAVAPFAPGAEHPPAEVFLERAREAFPDLEVRGMRMPESAFDYVKLYGQAGNPLTRDRANQVWLHPFTAEVLHVQRSDELGAAAFLSDAADPLHFGYFAGLPGKVLWWLFGMLLSFGILTGAYLWYLRQSGRRASGVGKIPHLRGAWGAAVLTLVYFAIVSGKTVDGIRDYDPPPQPQVDLLERFGIGPWQVVLERLRPGADGGDAADARLRLRFEGDAMPVYKRAFLRSEDGEIAFEGAAARPESPWPAGWRMEGTNFGRLVIEGVGGEFRERPVAVPALSARAPSDARAKGETSAWSGLRFPAKAYILLFVLTCALPILGWSLGLTLMWRRN